MSDTKICKTCKEEKNISFFAKYRYNGILLFKATCRDCQKPSRNKYYILNSDEIIMKNSKYKKENREKVNARERDRKKEDPFYKLYNLVRSVVKIAIKRNKGTKSGKSTLKYLEYSIEELKKYLESLFEPWMSWENHGKYDPNIWDNNDQPTWTWQLDHIIPQSDLPYTSMEDDNFKKCWALENLRPYSAKQNVIDGPSRIRHKKAA